MGIFADMFKKALEEELQSETKGQIVKTSELAMENVSCETSELAMENVSHETSELAMESEKDDLRAEMRKIIKEEINWTNTHVEATESPEYSLEESIAILSGMVTEKGA